MTFDELGLKQPILKALAKQNYTAPTPIQAQAIPVVLAGKDIVGLAQTGTGKTAAFTLPLLHRLSAENTVKPRAPRALILSPTRELSAQIRQSVRTYGAHLPLTSTIVVGGVAAGPQRKMLGTRIDILVATPGRLLDLIEQKALTLNAIETIILDEADQMLSLGFMPAIRRIMGLVPQSRQTLLFSATMPKEIRDLAAHYLSDPVEIAVAPVSTTAERVEQKVMHLTAGGKMTALNDLIGDHAEDRVIVFTRTKRGADKVVKGLAAAGIDSAAIHGNKSQAQRQRTLGAFHKGTCKVLIATDIAARGIDVPDVSLVVNYELPNVPEVYVHRIGRTARAGAEGLAVSFCAGEENAYLRDIHKLIGQTIAEIPAPDGFQAVAETGPAPRKRNGKKSASAGHGSSSSGKSSTGNRSTSNRSTEKTNAGRGDGGKPAKSRQRRRNRTRRSKNGQGGAPARVANAS